MGLLFGSDDSDLEDIEKEIEKQEQQIQQLEGEKQLRELRQRRKQELRKKKAESKKKQFKQTRAGRVFDRISDQLETVSERLEAVDGDGQNDSRKGSILSGALKPVNDIDGKKPAKDLEKEFDGTLEVTGTVEIEAEKDGSSKKKVKDSDLGLNDEIEGLDSGF